MKIDREFLKRFKKGEVAIFFKAGEDPMPCLQILGQAGIRWAKGGEIANEYNPRLNYGERAFYLLMEDGSLYYGDSLDLYDVLAYRREMEEIVKWWALH